MSVFLEFLLHSIGNCLKNVVSYGRMGQNLTWTVHQFLQIIISATSSKILQGTSNPNRSYMAYENPCLSRIMISQEEMESSYNAKLQQSKSSLSWQYFPLESCFRMRNSVGNLCYHVPCDVIIKLEEFSSSAFYRRNFTSACKCPNSHFQGMDSGMRFLGCLFIYYCSYYKKLIYVTE